MSSRQADDNLDGLFERQKFFRKKIKKSLLGEIRFVR